MLEAAVNGHADTLISFGTRYFTACGNHFGLPVLAPGDVIRRVLHDQALRLPTFIKAEMEKLAFADRRGKGDPDAFRALLTRQGGEPPRAGDEMP